jgi:hypothetical protein
MTCLGKCKWLGLDQLLTRAKAMPLSLWFAAAAVALPVMTYGYMSVKQAVVVYKAVGIERQAQQALCHSQLQSVASKVNAAADRTVAEAEAAARAVEPTPTNKAALAVLCKGSASCRDRSKP